MIAMVHEISNLSRDGFYIMSSELRQQERKLVNWFFAASVLTVCVLMSYLTVVSIDIHWLHELITNYMHIFMVSFGYVTAFFFSLIFYVFVLKQFPFFKIHVFSLAVGIASFFLWIISLPFDVFIVYLGGLLLLKDVCSIICILVFCIWLFVIYISITYRRSLTR